MKPRPCPARIPAPTTRPPRTTLHSEIAAGGGSREVLIEIPRPTDFGAEECLYSIVESLSRELHDVLPDAFGVPRAGFRTIYGAFQGCGGRLVEVDPGAPVDDGLERSTPAIANDGTAAGLDLD